MRFNSIIGRIVFSPDEPAAPAAPAVTPPAVTPPVVTPPAPSAHPVVAPWGSNDVWKIGAAGQEQPWYEAIPEQSVREGIAAKGYKNPAELAMAYNNAMTLQRNPDKFVELLPDNATPEQINAFQTKLGRPADKNGYELKMPEGIQTDPKMIDFAKDVSFKLGLNPSQAQALADNWNTFAPQLNAEAAEAERVQNEKDIATLETAWGADLNENKAAGRRALDALGIPKATLDKVDAAIGTAAIVELLATLGKKSAEGGFVSNGNGNGDPNDPANMTKEQAQAKITQLQADPSFQAQYTDRSNAGHKQAVELMEKLYAKA